MMTNNTMICTLFVLSATVCSNADASTYSNFLLSQNPTEYWRLADVSAEVSPPANNATAGGGVTLGSSTGTNKLRPTDFPGFESNNIWGIWDDGAGAALILPTGLLDSDEGTATYWMRRSTGGTDINFWGRSTTGSTDVTGSSDFITSFSFSDGDIGMKIEGTQIGTTATNVLTVDQWHHVAMTWDRNSGSADGEMRMYVDGLEVLSKTDATWTSFTLNGNMRFGKANANDGRYYNGAADEIAVWTRALTAQEIADQYAAAFPAPEPSTVLLAAMGIGGLGLVRRGRRG